MPQKEVEEVMERCHVDDLNRAPIKDTYDMAFSENNPGLTFKDRTPQTSTDLKDIFSKFETNGPVSKEILSRARFLCAKYLGGAWNKVSIDKFKIKPITGGMSNLLFLVELPPGLSPVASEPPNALLRIYLQNDLDQLLTESVVFTLLSERNLGPKLLGVFPGGRFEQFIASRPLQCSEISQPRFAKKIAPLLARTHTLDAPITKEPQMIDHCRNWLSKFRELPVSKQPIEMTLTEAQIDSKYFPKSLTVDDLEKELDFIEYFLQNSGSPVVFSHNDLHEGNIILFNGYELQDDGSVIAEKGYPKLDFPITMIDFEYCSFNYRGFDLGGHVGEYGYDYNISRPPYYAIYMKNFEMIEQRRTFCEAYLQEIYRLRAQRDNPNFPSDLVTGDHDKDLETLMTEAELFMPLVCMFWACWALLNAEMSCIAFGYGAHARDRLAIYFMMKPKLEAFLRNKGC